MSKEPISKIDADHGKLYFRGIEATELARTRSFEDVTYLLIYGRLPSKRESVRFQERMLTYRRLHEQELPRILNGLESGTGQPARRVVDNIDRAEMMGLKPLAYRVSHFSREYGLDDLDSLLAFVSLAPVVLAAGWLYLIGKPIVIRNEILGHAHNFFWMLKGSELLPQDERDLESCFILHMDDPGNPSLRALEKSVKRGSSLSESLATALDHHIDPLHHGAGEAMMKAMIEIGDSGNVEDYLTRVMKRGERIYGLGHRIYKTIDPRAVMLREILERRADNKETISLCKRIEETARIGSELILQRKNRTVHPNVDLYNAAVYHSFGIPYYLNTELFAVSRTAGWTAHIAEWMDLI
ncbi:MAG: citrate/2-methylcitrate synthase [Candidatus Thorarchaeota archaeon]